MEETNIKSNRNILYEGLLLFWAIGSVGFFLFSGADFPVLDLAGLTFGAAFVVCLIFMRPDSSYRHKTIPLIVSAALASGWFAYLAADYTRRNRRNMALGFALVAIVAVLRIAWSVYALLKAKEQTS